MAQVQKGDQLKKGGVYICKHPGDLAHPSTAFTAEVQVLRIVPKFTSHNVLVKIDSILECSSTAQPTIGSKRWVKPEWLYINK